MSPSPMKPPTTAECTIKVEVKVDRRGLPSPPPPFHQPGFIRRPVFLALPLPVTMRQRDETNGALRSRIENDDPSVTRIVLVTLAGIIFIAIPWVSFWFFWGYYLGSN
ncbi:hypothetical protein PT974_11128 [Cladobotryum mycophilum]|uniref:Uncharacterized protein n=1 Tax=Cladobotryum mycophilum TaxID=491253 RepID=A0ABR0S4H3_9HYPO